MSRPKPRAYPSISFLMSDSRGGSCVSRFTLAPLPEEVLDRIVDGVLVADLGKGHVLHRVEGLAQVLDELTAAVGALHLAVGELVHLGEDLRLEQVDAGASVVRAPVVAVGEVERI